MATKTIDTDLTVSGTVNATTLQRGGTAVPISTVVNDIITISQASYDALGGGRPSNRLYLITS